MMVYIAIFSALVIVAGAFLLARDMISDRDDPVYWDLDD